MTVALVGLGYWGSKLLRNLVALEGVAGVLAVDPDPVRVAAARCIAPGLRTFDVLQQALDDPEVDACVIATPVKSHHALVLQAVRAGRHVLVEKPLTDDIDQARQLVGEAALAGVQLMVGHTFLFSPAVAKMREYVEQGALGRVHYVTSSRLNLGLYRDDVNVIWDLAPHDFSIVCHVLGEFPHTVQATARSTLRPGVPDVAFINLEFPSGAIAAVSVSWLAPRKIRATVVVGRKRMIYLDESSPEEPIKVYDRGVVAPEDSQGLDDRLTYRYGDTIAPVVSGQEPLSIELRHFLDCVRTGELCRSDGELGLRIVEILAAADSSWRVAGRPVSVATGATVDTRARVVDLNLVTQRRERARRGDGVLLEGTP